MSTDAVNPAHVESIFLSDLCCKQKSEIFICPPRSAFVRVSIRCSESNLSTARSQQYPCFEPTTAIRVLGIGRLALLDMHRIRLTHFF